MSGPQDHHAVGHDACDRFFSIPELVRMFLEECSTQVLLNCTLVCNDWNKIITGTDCLQEHLFLKPARSVEGVRRKLNPMLRSHFAPILCPRSQHCETSPSGCPNNIEDGCPCTYRDILQLLWAQEPSVDAPMRRAFMRAEASWRGMLVSQPPVERIDWWHEWMYDQNVPDVYLFEATIGRGNDGEEDIDGWGHQDLDREFVTLGMLWDLVESRLARGCLARVHYFLDGKAVEDDPSAIEEERGYIAEEDRGQRQYTSSTPRVKITTQQIWNNIPWRNAGFDMKTQPWIDMPQNRHQITFGDGFNALRADCNQDWASENYRFSRSDGFGRAELMGESSGIVSIDEP